ncbi:hypothetical protein ECOPMV1_01274 [Escherichia coli PMV-1]|nr:hypothetical protein ECOPMV1_01274 [Escherichia coli PMV-1]
MATMSFSSIVALQMDIFIRSHHYFTINFINRFTFVTTEMTTLLHTSKCVSLKYICARYYYSLKGLTDS